MTAPILVLVLLAALPALSQAAAGPWRREALPALGSLEAVAGGGGRILATQPATGALVSLRPDSLAADGYAWRVAAGAGAGPGGLERPTDVEARLGLHLLVLDAGRGELLQYTRDLAFLGREALPADLDLARPELLAVSAGRTLVVADLRGGVAVRRPGEAWRLLLDFARTGELRPRSLETAGERVFLRDGEGAHAALLLAGTEGGWWRRGPWPGLAALHRAAGDTLLALTQRGDSLLLTVLAGASRLEEPPRDGGRLLAVFAAPAGLADDPVRDFLWVPEQAGGGLLLTRARGAALRLRARDGGP